MKKYKWGIVGAGAIAEKFAKDVNSVEQAELFAVGSRSLEKAQSFSESYGAAKSYGSYAELFQDPEVDIVYIATPHDSHAEISIDAMNAGKHVLCEKPMAVNWRQVEAMVEASKRNEVFLMEALWTRFNPTIIDAAEKVHKGVIGEVVYLNADFAFYLIDRPKARILSPELAGGALLDIGIYPVFLSYLLFGKPNEIKAVSQFHEGGVDIQTSMIFDYGDKLASLNASFITQSDMTAKIYGKNGSILIDPNWSSSTSSTTTVGDKVERFEIELAGNGFVYEINECHACLEKGKLESSTWSHQNSLDLAELLDSVREIVGLKYPFE